ncbi:MAG: hypothetical protein ACLGIG_08065 [Actinomycetes bacterium]
MQLSSAVVRAAVLVGVEATALALLGVGYAVAGVTSDAESRVGAVVGGLLMTAGAGLLLLVARGLVRHHPRAYAPAVAVQLLAGLTALSLLQTLPVVAVVVLVVAAAVLYSLATQEARRVFGPPGPPE